MYTKEFIEAFNDVNDRINSRWTAYLSENEFTDKSDTRLRIDFLKDPEYRKLAEEKLTVLRSVHSKDSYEPLMEDDDREA